MKRSLVTALAATFVIGMTASAFAELGTQKWFGDPATSLHTDVMNEVRSIESQGITRDFTFYVADRSAVWWKTAKPAGDAYQATFAERATGGFTTGITPTGTTMAFSAESNSRMDLWVFATKLNFFKGITPDNDLVNKTAVDYVAENYDYAFANPIPMSYSVKNLTAIAPKSILAGGLSETLQPVTMAAKDAFGTKWVYATNGTLLNDKVDCETGIVDFEIGLAPVTDASFKPHAGVYKGEVKVVVLHP